MLLLLLQNGVGGGGGGGYTNAFSDLNTVMVQHLAALRAANTGADLTTLLSKDLATAHGSSVSNQDDLNTACAEYLLSNN